MTYFGEVKSVRPSAWFTESELIGWSLAMFCMGASGAVVVLMLLGAQI